MPLQDVIARVGGFRPGDGFIGPLDLVEVGLMSAEEAQELHAMQASATPPDDNAQRIELEGSEWSQHAG